MREENGMEHTRTCTRTHTHTIDYFMNNFDYSLIREHLASLTRILFIAEFAQFVSFCGLYDFFSSSAYANKAVDVDLCHTKFT